MNGSSVRDLKSVQQALNALHPGEPAVLELERGDAKLSVSLEPEYTKSQASELLDYADISRDYIPQLGIIAVTMNPGIRRFSNGLRFPDGAIIAAKHEGISSCDSELEAGDVIHQVNGHFIHDAPSLRQSLAQARANDPLVLQVERGGHLMYIAINGQH
jgi:S1-C subfamily serine protease